MSCEGFIFIFIFCFFSSPISVSIFFGRLMSLFVRDRISRV